MPRKKKLLFSIKKGSLTALIALLIMTIVKLAESFNAETSQPVDLPSSSDPVQLYSNQTSDNLTDLYIDAIRSARHSITIVIFSLKDPQVIQALKDQSRAGIHVHIVCDAHASKGISKQCCGSTIQIVRRSGKGLTHQKILVVDQERLFIGSANFTTDSLVTHGNLVIGLKNNALASELEKKIKSMDEDGNSTPLLHKDVMIAGQRLEL